VETVIGGRANRTFVGGPQKDPQAALASGRHSLTFGCFGGFLSLGDLQGEGFDDVGIASLGDRTDYILIAQVGDSGAYGFRIDSDKFTHT
jgi:hypothetical protein